MPPSPRPAARRGQLERGASETPERFRHLGGASSPATRPAEDGDALAEVVDLGRERARRAHPALGRRAVTGAS